jgi:hypothetical protein
VIDFAIPEEAQKLTWFASEKRNRQRESGSRIRFPFGDTTVNAQHHDVSVDPIWIPSSAFQTLSSSLCE